ncbi:MAG: NFYB/HAP3 family transcription factor subunit [Candidatus Bathyarchaeia archaeon]
MGVLPKSPVRKMMRETSGMRVSKAATACLIEELEKVLVRIAKESGAFAAHAKRKTIKKEDVILSLRTLNLSS